MKEFLEAISDHGQAAFWIGVFILIVLGGLARWTIAIARSVTGKYPPPQVAESESDEEDES